MKQLFCTLFKVAAFVLVAAVQVWFAPILLSMLIDGSLAREKQRQQTNDYWVRRYGVSTWLRQFEQKQHKKRKKQWKKRRNFYS